ncbi:hypothetical protein RB195_015773 [Necator americanus]|uniref:Tyrosine-protein kinase n=1 Tax=Necator americanus TaxID=51031 RepID=A0ABR1E627_NECAM
MSKVKATKRKSTVRRNSGSTDRRHKKSASSTSRTRLQKSTEAIDSATDKLSKQIDKELTKHIWFHGVMPRSDCEEVLKNDGEFLVRRTTVAKVTTYCISVRCGGEMKHIPVAHENGMWILLDDKKPSLVELIDLYVSQKKPIPPSNSVLTKPRPRPEYFFLHKDVTLGKKLGRGAFGEVFAGKLKLKTGQEVDVAVKTARAQHLKKAQLNAFVREAKIMRRLDHPNIVRFYGVAAQEEPVMILLELAVNGCMKAYFRKTEVPVEQKLKFATDACRGMCYLSGAKVIHRDLAARNCLLGPSNEVKIADFGLSVMDKSELRLDKLEKVPVRWLSPETLTEGVFTTKTDVWSFGVLMWEIYASCKSDPFPGLNNARARELITGQTPPMGPPPNSPPIVKQIMDLCFVKDPNARPDFTAILVLLAPSEAPPESVRMSTTASPGPISEKR